jgi:general secretion pathway protein J
MMLPCSGPRRRHRHGFTLIELLVALVIFVLLAVMAYGGLNRVLDARDSFERHNDRLSALQMAFMLMGRDIEQTVDRPIRDAFGDPRPALLGNDGEGLELTRDGWRNPGGFMRSKLQRIGWRLDDGRLYRLTWAVLDRAPDSEPARPVLLDHVTALTFRFLDRQGEWQDQWPPAIAEAGQTDLPRAVEVTLELEDWGEVRRLFRVLMDRPEAPTANGARQ